MFRYKFDRRQTGPVDFGTMFRDARRVTNEGVVRVYAHNACDSSKRGSLVHRVVVPHRRVATDIVFLVVTDSQDGDWSVCKLADSLTTEHVVNQDVALLRPVWHTKLTTGKPSKQIRVHPSPPWSRPFHCGSHRDCACSHFGGMFPGEISPVNGKEDPLSWVLVRKVALEPGQCIAITTALS